MVAAPRYIVLGTLIIAANEGKTRKQLQEARRSLGTKKEDPPISGRDLESCINRLHNADWTYIKKGGGFMFKAYGMKVMQETWAEGAAEWYDEMVRIADHFDYNLAQQIILGHEILKKHEYVELQWEVDHRERVAAGKKRREQSEN